jgi:hypothetical protein
MSGDIPIRRGFKLPGRVIGGLALAASCFPFAYATTFHPVLPAHTEVSAEEIGAKIVAFAREQQGRQVGSGECTELAVEAMKRADARDVSAYGETSEDGDYVWGSPVALKDAEPGDIVQFRNFTIKTTIVAMEMYPGGRAGNSESLSVESRDHHTAIVEQITATHCCCWNRTWSRIWWCSARCCRSRPRPRRARRTAHPVFCKRPSKSKASPGFIARSRPIRSPCKTKDPHDRMFGSGVALCAGRDGLSRSPHCRPQPPAWHRTARRAAAFACRTSGLPQAIRQHGHIDTERRA